MQVSRWQQNEFQITLRYTAVELVFATIPDQELEINVPLEIDLNDYLPDGLIYTFGLKTGTELPTNFGINMNDRYSDGNTDVSIHTGL